VNVIEVPTMMFVDEAVSWLVVGKAEVAIGVTGEELG
jgi:hypothetical protein